MKFIVVLNFLILFHCFVSFGQENEELRDLLDKIESEKKGSIKVDLYVKVVKILEAEDSIKFNQYFDPAIDLARSIDYKKGEIDLLYRKANNLLSLSHKSSKKQQSNSRKGKKNI